MAEVVVGQAMPAIPAAAGALVGSGTQDIRTLDGNSAPILVIWRRNCGARKKSLIWDIWRSQKHAAAVEENRSYCFDDFANVCPTHGCCLPLDRLTRQPLWLSSVSRLHA